MNKVLIFLCACLLLTACDERQRHYNGYIDADLTYLSSDYPGRLTALFVKRGQSVTQNQLLFRLEQTHEKREVQMAQYNADALQAEQKAMMAQWKYAKINDARNAKMRKDNAASQDALDVAQKDLITAASNLASTEFQLQSSQVKVADQLWQVSRKENMASGPALVFDTYFTQDEYVQAGQPVLALITPAHIKAVFFVPETQLSRLVLEEKVRISSDGVSNLAKGHICYISPLAQYSPPIIYSREERTELVFRIEVCVDNPDLKHLHLGQPVTLELS